MPVTIRDKTTASNQAAVASDGSLTISVKGNGAPPSRSMLYWTLDQFPSTTASDSMMTMTESVNGASPGTFTSKTVSNGKTLRITSLSAALEGVSASVVSRCYIGIRFNTSGATSTGSPLMYRVGVNTPATAKTITNFFVDFPDGMEFAGDGTKTIGISAVFPDWVTSTNVYKLTLAIMAYEY